MTQQLLSPIPIKVKFAAIYTYTWGPAVLSAPLSIKVKLRPTVSLTYKPSYKVTNVIDDSTLGRIWLFPFAPDFAQDYTESLAWKSTVFESRSGKEQLMALREEPSISLSYTALAFHNDSALMRNTLLYMTGLDEGYWAVPAWHYPTALSAAASASADTLVVDDTALFQDYGVIFTSERDFFFFKIASKTSTTLTLDAATLPSRAWLVHSPVYPVVLTRHKPTVDIPLQASGVASAAIEFDHLIVPEQIAAEDSSTYLSYPVISGVTDWGRSSSVRFEVRQVELDNGVAFPYTRKLGNKTSVLMRYNWFLQGRSEIQKLRRWLMARKGKVSFFWCPSFTDDFSVLEVSGAGQILICEYNGFELIRASDITHLAVWYADRTVSYHRILGASEVNEQTLVSVEPAVSAGTAVTFASILFLSRLDSDVVSIVYRHPAFATATAPVRATFDRTKSWLRDPGQNTYTPPPAPPELMLRSLTWVPYLIAATDTHIWAITGWFHGYTQYPTNRIVKVNKLTLQLDVVADLGSTARDIVAVGNEVYVTAGDSTYYTPSVATDGVYKFASDGTQLGFVHVASAGLFAYDGTGAFLVTETNFIQVYSRKFYKVSVNLTVDGVYLINANIYTAIWSISCVNGVFYAHQKFYGGGGHSFTRTLTAEFVADNKLSYYFGNMPDLGAEATYSHQTEGFAYTGQSYWLANNVSLTTPYGPEVYRFVPAQPNPSTTVYLCDDTGGSYTTNVETRPAMSLTEPTFTVGFTVPYDTMLGYVQEKGVVWKSSGRTSNTAVYVDQGRVSLYKADGVAKVLLSEAVVNSYPTNAVYSAGDDLFWVAAVNGLYSASLSDYRSVV